MPTFVNPDWNPQHPAVHREDGPDDDGRPALALLRHPTQAYSALLPADPATWFDELRQVANGYLARVAPLDRALQRAALLLAADRSAGFGWLPIAWGGPAGHGDPVASFVVRRRADAQTVDASVVLLAANRVDRTDGSMPRPEGLGVGLRVVMHLAPTPKPQQLAVRVTGLGASRLAQALDPQQALRSFASAVVNEPATNAALQALIATIFRLREAAIGFDGFEAADDGRLRVTGVGDRGAGSARAYRWLIDIDPGQVGPQANLSTAALNWRLVEQFSEGGPAPAGMRRARLFLRDGASQGDATSLTQRRVTRRADHLDPLRSNWPLPPVLRDTATPPRFEVLQSRIADPRNDPDQPQQVDPRRLPLRSDHLAAAHAWRRGQELFGLIEDRGFDAADCFRFARLPLRLRHRAAFERSPDGRTVNAQVRPDAAPLAYLAPPDLAARPRLEVRFGAAQLRHRDLRPDDHGRVTAQPLGLAADPRWAWHEFGHVLMFAATGALEFQFAHSVGDALAALLHDPDSGLDRPRWCQARGETYPWVPNGRRHDREAALGWCWCGRRNGMRRAPTVLPPLLYKGYVEEQMLSSSLFRLYRAVGGDSVGATSLRRRAALACVDRVLRALLLLGPAGLLPVRSADAFLSALIDADIGSHARPGRDDVEGGCLHKVMRWAFEQQGLFATPELDRDVEGAGMPPTVDLWIEDQRPDADGGYRPVPLQWGDGNRPWHASARALTRDATHLHVSFANRGLQEASQITLRAWVARDAGAPLNWQPTGSAQLPKLLPGAAATASLVLPATLPPQARCLALVEVSCAADRANLDPASGLPMAAAGPPTARQALVDLVANDNNLALRWLPAVI